ncbi:MAG: tRNA modification GTPase MnmE [Bacteroidetes bacterium ADurb.Bin408]|nr:MAG: tRNA modification GTPase MnmE [Bacteroidetes bacterium ADurb.Bin408]
MKGKDLKPHIGIYGRRNNGKSALINYLTEQNTAIVSDHPGTTTDPVKKSVEIFGIGPAIIVDTAGIDDTGELGRLRVEKSLKTVPAVDMAILVITQNTFDRPEEEIIDRLNDYNVPFIVVHNKSDLAPLDTETKNMIESKYSVPVLDFSTFDASQKEQLIDYIVKTMPESVYANNSLFGGIVKPKDTVLLVTPIDSEAPAGRMILPQVMAWRDVLDNDCICVSVKESELEDVLKKGLKPSLVVTDSQVFAQVSRIVPDDIMLTSFSILFAHYRGNFNACLQGTPYINCLSDTDKVLILESCTHQVSCEDIGRYKIPGWIKTHTGKYPEFVVVSGLSDIPGAIEDYAIVIQCGGCMVTQKQLNGRLKPFIDKGIPVTNYGMVIAWMSGIFERVTEPFMKK